MKQNVEYRKMQDNYTFSHQTHCKKRTTINGRKRKHEETNEECQQTRFKRDAISPNVITIRERRDYETLSKQTLDFINFCSNVLVVVNPYLVNIISSKINFGCIIVDMADNDVLLPNIPWNNSTSDYGHHCDLGKLFSQLQNFQPKSIVFMIKADANAKIIAKTINSLISLRIVDKSAINENICFFDRDRSYDLFKKVFAELFCMHFASSFSPHITFTLSN